MAVGVAFLAALLSYVAFAIVQERRAVAEMPALVTSTETPRRPVWRDLIIVFSGLALTILGARWFVSGAVEFAAMLGVSEAVIGLTIVAVGTSLPELVTTLAAALRRQSAIAFGNIVGSNIFNVFFILGITALIQPVTVPASIAAVDIWVMVGASAALLAMVATGLRISRWEGAALLAAYLGYVAWLSTGAHA